MLAAILRRTACLGASLCLLACGSWDDQAAATTFARETLHCFDVAVERTEAHRFHARGCEREGDIVCSEGSLNPVCIRVAARNTSGGEAGSEGGETEDVEVASTEGDEPEPAPVETVSPQEQAIRRGLDARSEDVLACVDRPSVAVRVNHAADGSLSITLSGDLRDSPEEGCVRAAIGPVHVPPGAPGVVVHLVRRLAPAAVTPPAPTEATLNAPLPEPPAGTTLMGEIISDDDE